MEQAGDEGKDDEGDRSHGHAAIIAAGRTFETAAEWSKAARSAPRRLISAERRIDRSVPGGTVSPA
jgi:hypothetical protein